MANQLGELTLSTIYEPKWLAYMEHRLALATLSPVKPVANPGVRQVTTPGR